MSSRGRPERAALSRVMVLILMQRPRVRGVYKCGPSVLRVRQTGVSTQSRDDVGPFATSQGPGVQKCGPTFPQMNEEQNSKRLRTSEVGVNRQQECERFYVGDEDAIPTRYRVCGKSESGRLLKRKR